MTTLPNFQGLDPINSRTGNSPELFTWKFTASKSQYSLRSLHIWHISGSLTCFHLSSGAYPSHPKSTVKCCPNKICKADETRAVPKDSSPRASFSGMPRWLALTSGRKKNHRLGHGTKQQTIANHSKPLGSRRECITVRGGRLGGRAAISKKWDTRAIPHQMV